MQYWDTSTLLKLYVPEPDSIRFVAHLGDPSVCSSALARWELLRAMARKEMEGAIPANSAEIAFDRFLEDVNDGRVVLLPINAAVETRFRAMVLRLHRLQQPVIIRTVDAIHLATADLVPASEIVTTDAHLRAGATELGLNVFP
jgi:predicted nucleic acid-binding protein